LRNKRRRDSVSKKRKQKLRLRELLLRRKPKDWPMKRQRLK
jgi:hypothetical protein